MTEQNLWKLFEQLMDEKVKTDGLEESQVKTPRTFTEFMLEFLYMQYGLKALAIKQISAMVNALDRMAKRGHPYGLLFCRLLDVFTDKPLEFYMA
jgi:hypothetical protein